jgi:hypothetical protein
MVYTLIPADIDHACLLFVVQRRGVVVRGPSHRDKRCARKGRMGRLYEDLVTEASMAETVSMLPCCRGCISAVLSCCGAALVHRRVKTKNLEAHCNGQRRFYTRTP